MTDQNIQIRIKDDSQANQQDIKKALNLNQVLAQAKQPKNKKKLRLISVFLAILILILAGFMAGFFLFRPQGFSQYQKLIPEQAKAVIFLKTDQLKNLTPGIWSDFEQDSSYFQWLKDRISQFSADAQIIPENDIIPLFKEEVAFIVLSSASSANQKPNWAILAEIRQGQDSQKQITFEKVEQVLRRDFGLDELFYRQTKINQVYSLNQPEQAWYYTQVNNFIIVSGDLVSIQSLVDKIIKGGIAEKLSF